ncbi:MAG: hypothetical protein HAW67_03780 [Endozoicomonadaceae bacterium]|nr:hypothetical protein [Endozoicomonadaceae bacterium]
MVDVNQTSIDGNNVVIGLDWKSSKHTNSLLLHLHAKKLSKKENLPFGSTHINKSGEHTVSQYALTKKELDLESTVGGSLLSDFVTENYGSSNPDATFVFVKNLDDDTSNSDESVFWLCAFDSSGSILENGDCVVTNIVDLKDELSELNKLSEITLCHLTSDSSIDLLLPIWDEVNLLKRIDFTEKQLFELLERDSYNPTRFTKEIELPVKKIAFTLAGITSLFLLLFAWGYYQNTKPSEYFSQSIISEYTDNELPNLKKKLKKLNKKSKSWTQESFDDYVNEQFISTYLSHNFSSKEIGTIFEEIDNTFPLYSVEWKLTKVSFVNGSFFIFYKRIEGSLGTIDELTSHISDINKKTFEFTVVPVEQLIDEGKVKVFEVKPKAVSSMSQLSAEYDMKRIQYAQLNKKTLVSNSKLKKLYSSLNNHKVTFLNLSFVDLYILQKGSDYLDLASSVVLKIQKEKKNLSTVKSDFPLAKKLSAPSNWFQGRLIDFVTMTHADSLFDWSFPQLVGGIPDKRTLNKRNEAAIKKNKSFLKPKKKAKKRKQTKLSKVFKQAINFYSVEVTTQANSSENGKIASYGVADLKKLMTVVSKPYIQIERIDYLKDTENWVVTLIFYTPFVNSSNSIKFKI